MKHGHNVTHFEILQEIVLNYTKICRVYDVSCKSVIGVDLGQPHHVRVILKVSQELVVF